MLKAVSQFLRRLHADERGAMSVEKILILAVISIPLVIVLYTFRGYIMKYFTSQTSDLDQKANTGTGYN